MKPLQHSLSLLLAASLMAAPASLHAETEAAESSIATFGTEEAAPVDSAASLEEGSGSFFFPGGYGYLPETISALGGLDVRPPIDITFSLSQGYTDNANFRASGNGKEGAWMTRGVIGTNILLSRQRTFLSLSASGGATAYWMNHSRNKVRPYGRIGLAYAYKATPRLEITSRLSGGYYDQPELGRGDYLARYNSGGYMDIDFMVDATYRWTPLFSTTTSVGGSTIIYNESEWRGSNYFNFRLGQVFRYQASPLLSTVLDLRFSKAMFRDSIRDSISEYALAGFDLQWTKRLSASFRGGAEFRQFRADWAENAVSPFFEATLGYRFGRGSFIQWINRYGFEEGIASTQKNQSLRTGVQLTHIITPRITGRLGGSYSHQRITNTWDNDAYTQHLYSANVGFDFAINRAITVSTDYRFNGVTYDYDHSLDYTANEIMIGATYRF